MREYMSPQHIADEIARVTYKPGWEFRCYTHPFEGTCVRIEFTAPDSTRPGHQAYQGVNIPVPPLVDHHHLHDWLMWRLKIVEMHELSEFYRVSGVMPHDPHSDDYWSEASEHNIINPKVAEEQ